MEKEGECLSQCGVRCAWGSLLPRQDTFPSTANNQCSCPVCLDMPGTYPVLLLTLRVALHLVQKEKQLSLSAVKNCKEFLHKEALGKAP